MCQRPILSYLDHEGGKGLLADRNKVAVFNRDGHDVFSASTRETWQTQ